MKATAQPCIELEEYDPFSAAAKGVMRLPYPVLIEVLDRHVFKDLSHTDRSLEAARAKFAASRELIDNALSKWRADLEYELVKLVSDGRDAQRREVPAAGGELISGQSPNLECTCPQNLTNVLRIHVSFHQVQRSFI